MSYIVVTPLADLTPEQVKILEDKLTEVVEPMINLPITRLLRDKIMQDMKGTLASFDPPRGAVIEYDARDNKLHLKVY